MAFKITVHCLICGKTWERKSDYAPRFPDAYDFCGSCIKQMLEEFERQFKLLPRRLRREEDDGA